MASPSWAPHVASFCDLSGGDAAHGAAREALAAALADGSATLLDMARLCVVRLCPCVRVC
jgi:hypothetical protein